MKQPGGSERRFSIEVSRRAACPPEVAMTRILDPASWPAWQPEIVSARGPSPVGDGDVVEGSASMLGFEVEGRSESISATTEHFEEDVLVGVRMRIRYEVRPSPEGCIVNRHLVAQLPGGFAGRILSLLLKRRLRAMQNVALDRLVAQAEAGSDS